MAKRAPIEHVEWRTRDPERLKAFYGGVFKWRFKKGGGGYTVVKTGDKGLAGIILALGPGDAGEPEIGNYITVRDLETAEAAVAAHGGRVLASKVEVPAIGWFSTFTDPDGNVMHLWQAMGKKARKTAKKAAKKQAKAARKG